MILLTDAVIITFTGSTVPFWCLAATVTLVNLARRLPLQNVLSSTAMIGSVGLGLAMLVGRTGTSGTLEFSRTAAVEHQIPPWCFPLVWIVVVINCRAVARLVLQAWPRRTYAGFWTLGLASVLIAAIAISGAYRITNASQPVFGLNAFPHDYAILFVGLQFVGWVVAGSITLVLIAPWLINKRLVRETVDFGSLATWLLLNLYFSIGLAMRQAWFAAGFGLILTTFVTARAIHGARQWNRVTPDNVAQLRRTRNE